MVGVTSIVAKGVREISSAERRKAKERYAYRKENENESMQRVGNRREDILQLHGDVKNLEEQYREEVAIQKANNEESQQDQMIPRVSAINQ